MKRSFVSLCFCLCTLSTTYTYGQQKIKKAVFIIVDGVAADVIEKLPTPGLHSIANDGGYTRAYVGGEKGAYSETPTISAVGYNSILTGTWANKHNVWDNSITNPNYNYHTIFRYCKEQYPHKKTAIFSSWLDNRTKLVGDNLPATGNIPVDYHYDGLELDTINYPHDKQSKYMSNIDESVTKNTSEYIRTNGPDLSWVYLEFTDDMGHMYGDSPEYYKAVDLADEHVGEIWKAIQYREKNFDEDWLIIITTDHGRDAETGKGHGGQSDRERAGWIFTNAKNLNEEFHQPYASVVDIMPTIARFMDITIPRENLLEVDGVPFIGKISAISPKAQYQNNKIQLQWQATGKEGKMKIWLSTANQFKTGGKDDYKLIAEVPASEQQATINVGNKTSDFYKIVLEAPHNYLNRWIVSSNKTKQEQQ